MAPNRGTDATTDERQLRPREENDALGQWLEDLFDASAEVLVFSIPMLAVTLVANDPETTLLLLVALTAGIAAVGAKRHELRDEDARSPRWPRMSPSLALARIPLYNVALFVGIALGRSLFAAGPLSRPLLRFQWVGEPVLGPSAVAAAVTVGAVGLFPYLVAVLNR